MHSQTKTSEDDAESGQGTSSPFGKDPLTPETTNKKQFENNQAVLISLRSQNRNFKQKNLYCSP